MQITISKERLKAIFIHETSIYTSIECILVTEDTDNVTIIADKEKENKEALEHIKDWLQK